jgi:hypothetical protein
MESSLIEFDGEDNTRPTLLTVLCVLSFIGSSWLIITNIWGYATASRTAQLISSVSKMRPNDSTFQNNSPSAKVVHKKRALFGEKMILSFSKVVTAENIRKNAVGTILSAVITFWGALLMWRLRRRGFYLYIAGTLFGIAVPFYLYGINLMSVGISVFSGFFGLVFIALYALNIKSLR